MVVPVGGVLAELDMGAAAVGAARGVAAVGLLHLPGGGVGGRSASEAAAEAAAEAGGRQRHVQVKVGQGGGAAPAADSGRSCGEDSQSIFQYSLVNDDDLDIISNDLE